MIAERYTPRDRLTCELEGLSADFFVDYWSLRRSKRGNGFQRGPRLSPCLTSFPGLKSSHNPGARLLRVSFPQGQHCGRPLRVV